MPQAPTPAVSVTMTDVVYQNNRYLVRFSNGHEDEFQTLEEVGEYVSQLGTVENAERLMLAWALARDANLTGNVWRGKTLTLDLSAAAPLKVQ